MWHDLEMGFHHLAIAVKDIEKTHRFYTEAMGFTLAKVEVVPKNGGVARHLFYSTGPKRDQLIAFWDYGNVPLTHELKTDISQDLGFEPGTNHIAFSAEDLGDLKAKRERWQSQGHDVLEIDHGWVHSIYTRDPDGIVVEFAVLTRDFTGEDAAEAIELLRAKSPQPGASPKQITRHRATPRA
jgi:catechol 2,3-dioxygenase-like lactoylglutathione lyase family enzyme